MSSTVEIRGVLDYLLAHDEDGTFNDPYLCYRIVQMREEGQISFDLSDAAQNFIHAKIMPCAFLTTYHLQQSNQYVSYAEPKWATIRRDYLAKWIIELAREDEACERLIEEELNDD